MFKRLRQWLRKQFTEHPGAYIFAVFTFTAGFCGGIYYYHTIGSEQVPQFRNCLDGYILYIAKGNADRWGIFWNSLWNNLQTLGLLMICGLHPALTTFSPMFLFGRGFILGFTVTVLVQVMGWQGVPVLLLGILPQYIILIPLLLFGWVLCYSRVKERFTGPRVKKRFRINGADGVYFRNFFFAALVAVGVAGCLALILPVIMSGVYGFLQTYI